MNKEEIIRILEELVEADKEPVSLPEMKKRLSEAGAGDPRLDLEKLNKMDFNQFQEVLVSVVNEVIE